MAWNLNFNEKTQLREWWKIVRDNFIHLMDKINVLDKDVDRRIIANSSVTPSRHIGQLSEQSEWLTSDVYLVATETDGAYDEYAFIDGEWMVVNKTSLEGFATSAEVSADVAELSGKILQFDSKLEAVRLLATGAVKVYCGAYSNPTIEDEADGIQTAFINLGFTPKFVKITSQFGECVSGDISGTVIGGIAMQNSDLTVWNGEIGHIALEIVTNGFKVRAFSKGDAVADLITGKHYYMAISNCSIKNYLT